VQAFDLVGEVTEQIGGMLAPPAAAVRMPCRMRRSVTALRGRMTATRHSTAAGSSLSWISSTASTTGTPTSRATPRSSRIPGTDSRSSTVRTVRHSRSSRIPTKGRSMETTQSGIVALTTDNFHDVVNTDDVVVIDISATWCTPCRAFTAVFDEAAAETPTTSCSPPSTPMPSRNWARRSASSRSRPSP